MPPEISTTRRPTAKIRLTELVFSRLNKLAKVRKCVLLSDSATDIPRSKAPARLRLDGPAAALADAGQA